MRMLNWLDSLCLFAGGLGGGRKRRSLRSARSAVRKTRQRRHCPVAAEIESVESRALLTPTLSLPASVDVNEDVTVAGSSDVEIATFTVTDAYMVDISAGNDDGHFYVTYDYVDTASLYVSAMNPLDFETAASHVLTIEAWDMMMTGSASGSLTVNVLDVAEDPTFTGGPFNFSVAEDAASGTLVGTVTATDPQNDLYMFSISSGDPNGDFSIDSSGQITVQGTLDYETTPSYTLGVDAMDMGGNSASTNVTITVTDVNEKPTAVDLSKNTLGYSPVTINPAENATDPEGAVLTSTIVTGPSFGTLTDNGDGTWDYELTAATQETFDSFTYRANDGTNDSDNVATVTIYIDWATISITEGDTGEFTQIGESLTDTLGEGTFSLPLGFDISVSLPTGYSPGEFFVEIETSGVYSGVFSDSGATTAIPPGTDLALAGGVLNPFVLAGDEGEGGIKARLKRLHNGIKKFAQRSNEARKAFNKKVIDGWKKFTTVLSDGKDKLKEKIKDKITDTVQNTPIKVIKGLLEDVVNDATRPQVERDRAQTYLNNLGARKDAIRDAVIGALFDKTKATAIAIVPQGKPEDDILNDIQQDLGTVDPLKWKPEVKLRTDALLPGTFNGSVEDYVTTGSSAALDAFTNNPAKLIESVGVKGEYTPPSGGKVTVEIGITDFDSGNNWKKHKYQMKLTGTRGGRKIDLTLDWQPEDITGQRKYDATLNVIFPF